MGANLQALSTYNYLKNHGFEPVILNWVPSDVEKYYIKNVSEIQRATHKAFQDENFINITEICRSNEDIAHQIQVLDIHFVCVGSDAVFSTKPYLSQWHIGRRGVVRNKPYSDGTPNSPFWGEFVKYLPIDYSIELVALSVSAQNTPYKKILFNSEKRKYRNALKRFSKITVRDIWTKEMCEYVSGMNISPEITPDPVFGYNYNVKSQPLNYVKTQLGIEGNYALLSVSSSVKDTEWIRTLEKLFAEDGIVLIGLPKTNSPFSKVLKYNLDFPISPDEWYDAIKYSKGYIGELMHPVLVSLHNAVPVYAFDTYGFKGGFQFDNKSSKTYQIMRRFDLLCNYYNRLYNSLPTPEEVHNRIQTTNTAKIAQIAAEMLSQYKNMMSELLK